MIGRTSRYRKMAYAQLRKDFRFAAVAWAILAAPCLIFLTVDLHDYFRRDSVISQGAVAEATITLSEMRRGIRGGAYCYAEFVFNAAGQGHYGHFTGCSPDTRSGGRLTVAFDRDDPGFSFPQYQGRWKDNAFGSVTMSGVLLAFWTVIAGYMAFAPGYELLRRKLSGQSRPR